MAAQKSSGLRRARLGVDVGLTNTDLVLLAPEAEPRHFTLPSLGRMGMDELAHILDQLDLRAGQFESIHITGGQTKTLPDALAGTPLIKVGEMEAIGRGGLYLAQHEAALAQHEAALAQHDAALVVSAGSGTAMVSARMPNGPASLVAQHVTGTAVGGGTLQGLAGLLLGTTDALAINALAEQGNANGVDLTLLEATGGAIGHLPADANAVNFGKVARMGPDWHVRREDIASGLVRLVSQVIAVIAINAAKAEQLPHIVVIGHLADLTSVRKVLAAVAGYYDAKIVVPVNPGYGTAMGAVLSGLDIDPARSSLR